MCEGERRTLVVVDYIPQVILPGVVSFAHTHGVVGEIHIAVVTFEVLVGLEVLRWMCERRNLQKSARCQSRSPKEEGEERELIFRHDDGYQLHKLHSVDDEALFGLVTQAANAVVC